MGGEAQRRNRVVLYDKDQIPMEKLQNLGEPWPPWFLRVCICSRYINGKAHDAQHLWDNSAQQPDWSLSLCVCMCPPLRFGTELLNYWTVDAQV